MNDALFFHDTAALIDVSALRARARRILSDNPLIRSAVAGHLDAVRALHAGYWPFVAEFERAIDRHSLPRQPLRRRFATHDPARVRTTFVALARELAEMRDEEGSHALHWKRDARAAGLDLDRVPADGAVDGVAELLRMSFEPDLPRFFGMLAGTEVMAEELSAVLTGSPEYLACFERNRWVWGEIHLTPHDGASHLDVDLDLGRAYSADDATAVRVLTDTMVRTLQCFDEAALQIAQRAHVTQPMAA